MKIAVLMSTYNGEKYLDEQLKSIYEQSVSESIFLYVRDDGSNDRTIEIIENWMSKINIILIKGTNVGPAKGFWELFSSEKVIADYYAFCDQDDIWDRNKIQVGINALEQEAEEALWCSNCRIVDKSGRVLMKKMNENDPNFDIISQFVCGTTQGCAMLFNNKLRNYILKNEIHKFPMHDFVVMTYALAKGKVIYDQNPYFSYRVHDNNVVAKEGKNKFEHFKASFNRWFSNEHKNELSEYAYFFLRDNSNYLDEDVREYIENIIKSKTMINSRIKLVFDNKTIAENKKAVRAFKIKTILGVI